MYIYIYIERERDYIIYDYVCVYIYIYIYIHTIYHIPAEEGGQSPPPPGRPRGQCLGGLPAAASAPHVIYRRGT